MVCTHVRHVDKGHYVLGIRPEKLRHFVFGDRLVDQLVHSLVEPIFIEVFTISFLIKRAICFVTKTLQFFGKVASLYIGASPNLTGRVLSSHK